jgi:phosphohistidine phosphatase
MDLVLWRHAEAHPARDGEDDLQRALTHRGERQARRMAEWLNHRLAHSTRIIVSPALRAQQTARALGSSFRVVEALRPDAPVEAVLQAAHWPDAGEPVLVVGHQPTLGMVAAYVVGGEAQPWAMKKGAVWWLRGRDTANGPEVIVHAVRSPDGL